MNRTPIAGACLLALALAACSPQQNAAPTAAEPAAETATPAATDAALDAAIAGAWRDPANIARDAYRHPGQTLAFFGIAPDQTVVEITPGGGWYAEILAPYLKEQGHYVAAIVDPMAVEEGRGNRYVLLEYVLQKRDAAATTSRSPGTGWRRSSPTRRRSSSRPRSWPTTRRHRCSAHPARRTWW